MLKLAIFLEDCKFPICFESGVLHLFYSYYSFYTEYNTAQSESFIENAELNYVWLVGCFYIFKFFIHNSKHFGIYFKKCSVSKILTSIFL